MTKYKIIFTSGDIDDTEWISREVRGDVLILDEQGNYYDPIFITLNRIKIEFDKDQVCYLENKMVILHEITKDNILKSIIELDRWMFTKQWISLSEKHLREYFYPKEDWLIFDTEVENNSQ